MGGRKEEIEKIDSGISANFKLILRSNKKAKRKYPVSLFCCFAKSGDVLLHHQLQLPSRLPVHFKKNDVKATDKGRIHLSDSVER